MTNFFIDLISVTHDFYWTRDRATAKTFTQGLCVITCLFFCLNVCLLYELVTGIRVPLPLGDRNKVMAFGLATMGILLLCVKLFVRLHPVLQSVEQMRQHSLRLTRRRKATLLSMVVSNLVLFLVMVGLIHR